MKVIVTCPGGMCFKHLDRAAPITLPIISESRQGAQMFLPSPLIVRRAIAAAITIPLFFVAPKLQQGWHATPLQISSPCIVFSVAGLHHTSNGNEDVIAFPQVITDVGGGWIAPDAFLVPRTGVYYFSLSFVKTADAGTPPVGTSDDVYMRLRRNGAVIGYAWAGETTYPDRSTGAYSVAIHLNQGEIVDATAYSDGVPPNEFERHLYKFEMTGFMVCDG